MSDAVTLFGQFLAEAERQQRAAYDKSLQNENTKRLQLTSDPLRDSSDSANTQAVREQAGVSAADYIGPYQLDNKKAADYVTQQFDGWSSDWQNTLDTQQRNNADRLEAERTTALQQLLEQNAQMKMQAEQQLKSPLAAPIPVAQMEALAPVTRVNTDPSLQGFNSATQQFYVSPDSIQSQFNVGAPVGGGGIGQRQKTSTSEITSRPDALGTRSKDEL